MRFEIALDEFARRWQTEGRSVELSVTFDRDADEQETRRAPTCSITVTAPFWDKHAALAHPGYELGQVRVSRSASARSAPAAPPSSARQITSSASSRPTRFHRDGRRRAALAAGKREGNNMNATVSARARTQAFRIASRFRPTKKHFAAAACPPAARGWRRAPCGARRDRHPLRQLPG